MKMSVKPTMQSDGALHIEVTCDEYASIEHFLDRDGLKNAVAGVKEGIRAGHYKDIRLIAFFNQPSEVKDVDVSLTRFDGTKIGMQNPQPVASVVRHHIPESQTSH